MTQRAWRIVLVVDCAEFIDPDNPKFVARVRNIVLNAVAEAFGDAHNTTPILHDSYFDATVRSVEPVPREV